MAIFLRKKLKLAAKAATVPCACIAFLMGAEGAAAQQPDAAAVIRGVDASVKMRLDHIAQYTDTETYKVFRGGDEKRSVAEMVVKTTYRPETGKNYQIISQSGSGLIQRVLLKPLLENEKAINAPGKVSASWIVSANYHMTLYLAGPVMQDGRQCWQIAIHPRQKAPNLINGTLWVDVKDDSIVRLEGTPSKSPSFFAGAAHMLRQYVKVDGFAEAVHARAESDSFLGKTVITIDYQGYQIQSK